MNSNPTRYVVVAMALTAVLFLIAGPKWSKVATVQPVKVATK